LRKTNYRQQKKTREDARKARHAKKQGRREVPGETPGAGAGEVPGTKGVDADGAQSSGMKPLTSS